MSELLNDFYRRYETIEATLTAAIAAQDYPTAQRWVHRLKGVSGHLGMVHLHQASCQLNDRLKAVATLGTEGLEGEGVGEEAFDPFRQALQQIFQTLTVYRVAVVTEPQSWQNVDHRELNRLLQQLQQQLEQYHFTAATTMEQISELLKGIEDPLLVKLQQQMSDFDYSAALETLSELSTQINP